MQAVSDMTDHPLPSPQPAIEAHGLNVHYPETHALRDVTFSIAPGAFVLIGGPSGSGKSTLAHTLMGLLSQEEDQTRARVTGEVSVAGLSPTSHSVARLATRAGLVFQNPATQLFNGTVRDEVAFGPRNLGLSGGEIKKRVAYALEAAGCAHLRGRAVRRLSGGEQQRVAIAASLAMRPSILILDEPAANLDSAGAWDIVEALARLQRQHGVTIVVIEHRLEPFLAHADRLLWLDEGRIVADGPPEQILPQVQSALPPASPFRPPTDEPLVSLDRVTAGYNGRAVLQNCSLTVRQGEFAALVGPNGAGKSTLARVLAGLLRPRQGRVIWHKPKHTQSPCPVGLLQQNPLHQLVCDTVEKDIRFGPRNFGTEQSEDVENALARIGLQDLRYRSTQALSVGEQQRAALAATLILHPRLLILDEPTIGQDRRNLNQMMNFSSELNQQGQTILLITHDQYLVERYAMQVWALDEGNVRTRRS